jgi:acetolactate synthase-1/2/3 large subunit
VVDAAARLALAAPAGAVQLVFDPTTPGDEAPLTPAAAPSDPEAFAQAGTLLADARRPVVIVGVDAMPHSAAVRNALQDLDCPVLVTYEAKGVVPESWPTYAGLFTGASVERPLLEQADVILGIGLDPVEPMPGPWPYPGRTVLLHSHEVETAYFGQPMLLIGSYGAALAGLVRACRPQWPTGTGAQVRKADLARLRVETAGLNPLDVVLTTQDAVGDVLATVDAGAHMLAVMPVWETDEPDSVLISNGLATMGFALPAAIAMALARPGRRVVCFVGDGGLSMVLGELETLGRLGLDVTVVVFDDAMLTLIKLKQTSGQAGSRAVAYRPVDFAAVSSGLGVPGRRAGDIAELRATLDGPRSGPLVVDARIDASAYPHIMKMTRG